MPHVIPPSTSSDLPLKKSSFDPNVVDLSSHFKNPAPRTQGLDHEMRTGRDGRRRLHVPIMTISDLHLGTSAAEAKKLCHMLENTDCDHLVMIGDIIDMEAMMKKDSWKFGFWHRQAIAHVLRKQAHGTRVTYVTGNHDGKLRGREIVRETAEGLKTYDYRKLSGKSIMGIEVTDRLDFTAPDGRRAASVHGDGWDNFNSVWYHIGDAVYTGVSTLDRGFRKLPKCDEKSLAESGKKIVKTVLNEMMGLEEKIAAELDASDRDIIVYGHSHIVGMSHTPAGKLVINGGSSTAYVQGSMCDRNGRWATINRWRKSGVELATEHGQDYTLDFDAIGLDAALNEPAAYNDQYVRQADRAIRLLFRSCPARDRQKLIAKMHDQQVLVMAWEAVKDSAGLAKDQKKHYRKAVNRLESLAVQVRHNPVSRHVEPVRDLPHALPSLTLHEGGKPLENQGDNSRYNPAPKVA